MTDLNTLTKAELNALLVSPFTPTQLKKKSKDDLIAMLGELPETAIGAALTIEQFAATPEAEANAETWAKAAKPARKARTLEDRVIQKPAADLARVRPMTDGSKRHLLAQALQRGATLEHLIEVTGWSRSTVTSALRWDMGQVGLGVERKGDKYFLIMPEGLKRLPVREATISRADALVAACK